MLKNCFFAAILTGAVIVSGCQNTVSDLAQKVNPTSTPTPASKTGVYNYNNPGFLRDKTAISNAVEELKKMDKFANKKIMVFQNLSLFDDGRIIMEIQDPNQKDNIDHYEFSNGKWAAPEPVRIEGKGKMDDNLTALDEINIAAVPEMMSVADEKAKEIEGGKPQSWINFLHTVSNGNRRWNLSVEGIRAKYSLDFDKNGKLKKFDKY